MPTGCLLLAALYPAFAFKYSTSFFTTFFSFLSLCGVFILGLHMYGLPSLWWEFKAMIFRFRNGLGWHFNFGWVRLTSQEEIIVNGVQRQMQNAQNVGGAVQGDALRAYLQYTQGNPYLYSEMRFRGLGGPFGAPPFY